MQGQWGILRGTRKTYPLVGPNVDIGREETNAVVLDNSQSISKKHAVIVFNGPQSIQVKDLKSRNGTFINRNRIQNSHKGLQHGDVIRFGYDPNSYRLELADRSPINSPVGKAMGPRFGSRFGFGESPTKQELEWAQDFNMKRSVSESRQPSQPHLGLSMHNGTVRSPMQTGTLPEAGAMPPGPFSTAALTTTQWHQPQAPMPHPTAPLPTGTPRQPHQTTISYPPLNLVPGLQNDTNRHLEDLIARNREKEVELAKFETERRVLLQKELESLRQQLTLEQERQRLKKEADDRSGIEPRESMLSKALTKKIERIQETMDALEKRLETVTNPMGLRGHQHSSSRPASPRSPKRNPNLRVSLKDMAFERQQGWNEFPDPPEPIPGKSDVHRTRQLLRSLLEKSSELRDATGKPGMNFEMEQYPNPSFQDIMDETIHTLATINDTLTPRLVKEISGTVQEANAGPKTPKKPRPLDIYASQAHFSPRLSPRPSHPSLSVDPLANSVHAIPGSPSFKRDKEEAEEMNNMYKQYVATLQSEVYQLRMMVKTKEKENGDLLASDWAQKLQIYQNRVKSLERHLRLEHVEKQRLFKMFGELSQKVEKTSADGIPMGAGRTALTEFVQNNSKKLLLAKAEIAELKKRKDERLRRWNAIKEEAEIAGKKAASADRALKSQRDQFRSLLEQKDMALMKATRQLAAISGSAGGDRKAAAKFLIDKLNTYVQDQNEHVIALESLETSLRLKMEENQRIKSEYQGKLDKLSNAQRVQELEDELAEERQHQGPERIAKLDSMIGQLQKNVALKNQETTELKDDLRELAQKWPSIDEGATVAFLSGIMKTKDDSIGEATMRLQQAEAKIATLEQAEESLRRQCNDEKREMETMQNRHVQVNKLLHQSGINMAKPPPEAPGTHVIEQELGLAEELRSANLPASAGGAGMFTFDDSISRNLGAGFRLKDYDI